MDATALRNARTHVKLFTEETSVLKEHQFAMQCRDCEDYLQIGIDAFHWLERADRRIQEMVCQGIARADVSVDDALTILYETWLKPCPTAEMAIENQRNYGFEIDNVNEFRRCCERAAEILASRRLARAGFEALANSGESW